MTKFKPFKDEKFDDYVIREFDSSKDDSEFIWHVDEFDREIEIIETDGTWSFQYDNELPFIIKESFKIKKGCYHRLIKGEKKLKIKIKEDRNGNS
jgi:hypothetical protein